MISFETANRIAQASPTQQDCYKALIRHYRRRTPNLVIGSDFLDSANLVMDCWRALPGDGLKWKRSGLLNITPPRG